MSDIKTILVADDDRETLIILRHILEVEGYRVISEIDGVGALNLARESNPDLIMLDMIMPGMSGLEVLKSLQGDDPPVMTPAILLTGSDPDDCREDVASLTSVRFIEKPFDMDVLIQAVKDGLGGFVEPGVSG